MPLLEVRATLELFYRSVPWSLTKVNNLYQMLILTESDIGELTEEAKSIPEGLYAPFRLERNGHRHKGFEFDGESGSRFVVKIRQAFANPMNFSVILGYMLPGTYSVFRLRRYNGKSHFHSNVLEGEPRFYDYHIHLATERYQVPGFEMDHYAEITSRFYDLKGAVDCMVNDCGFRPPLADTPLFRGVV